MNEQPTVTIAIPVLNEEAHIEACLNAVAAQTYPNVVETLVVDGGSTDRTRELAVARPGVRILNNPRRIQAAALNIALGEAKGDVFIRVDGHCVVAADYVDRCVAALARTGAAMVGGGMTPVGKGSIGRGIAAAMSSPLGAGPARFHVGGRPGWVDTVYLGAYHAHVARDVGGYSERVGVNEDAELAIRMARKGGVWYDPLIRSSYRPRAGFLALGRQFHRYGQSRAATLRRHPRSLAPRQLASPLLVVGLLSPRRRIVLALYLCLLVLASWRQRRERDALPGLLVALPVMHLSWGIGFLRGLFEHNRDAFESRLDAVNEIKRGTGLFAGSDGSHGSASC